MQEAYNKMHAYYSRPDTILGRTRHGACEYVGQAGETQRCAIGCTLPMELLDESGPELNALGGLESIKDTWDEGNLLAEKVFDALGLAAGGSYNPDLFTFLTRAQDIHDSYDAFPTKADVLTGLKELAESYGLEVAS